MSDMAFKVGIYTLGCKVNQYESEAIAEALQKHNIKTVSASEKCDAYIINTCTVTAESDRKAKQFIRRARSKNPEALIYQKEELRDAFFLPYDEAVKELSFDSTKQMLKEAEAYLKGDAKKCDI